MHLFKNTIVAAHKLRVQAANFRRSLRFDLLQHVVNPLAEKLRPFGVTDFVKNRLGHKRPRSGKPDGGKQLLRPSIFVSYATDESLKGSHRYCGGEKLLNNLVLLLRRHGYDAYMVSMDGAHSDWLVEHAPFLSLQEFARRAATAQFHPMRHVVGSRRRLPPALPEILLLGSGTGHHHAKPVSGRWPDLCARRRILATAGLNRSIQAWHMAIFERRASLLRTLVDEKHWKPDETATQSITASDTWMKDL